MADIQSKITAILTLVLDLGPNDDQGPLGQTVPSTRTILASPPNGSSLAKEPSNMGKKKKKEKSVSVTTFLILFVICYSLIVFFSGQNPSKAFEISLGVIGILVVIAILAVIIIDSRRKKEKRRIFILYSQEDTDFVAKLYNALKITPYTILWDKKDIQAGDHIEEQKNRLLEESNSVIVVISKHITSSDWMKSAIARTTELKKRILPVRIDDTEPPEGIQDIMFADFRTSFDDGYFALRDALKPNRQDKPSNSSAGEIPD